MCARHVSCSCWPSLATSEPLSKELAMNWEKIAGEWREAKGKLRAKWGKLTDDDLEAIAGRKDVLVGRLQQRYGRKKEEAERDVDTFLQGL
jgi:uncharacterized protein YjbJ (UPF0337 family)